MSSKVNPPGKGLYLINTAIKTFFQQEHFEPKSPFKYNDLKGLVNVCRDNWTDVEPVGYTIDKTCFNG